MNEGRSKLSLPVGITTNSASVVLADLVGQPTAINSIISILDSENIFIWSKERIGIDKSPGSRPTRGEHHPAMAIRQAEKTLYE